MKTITTLALIGASALTLAAGAASAQPARYDRDYGRYDQGRHDQGRWMSINERQANLDRRIDMGLRNGSLTRTEAYRLRSEFRDIARMEDRYRRNGLNNWERADLDRRFDRLAAQIRYERHDNQYGYNDYRR